MNFGAEGRCLKSAPALLLALILVCSVEASGPPSPGAVAESPARIEQRIEYIAHRLDASRRHAAAWQYGWATLFVGSIAFNAAELRGGDSDDQVRHGVEIAKTLGGLIRNLTAPLPQRHGSDPIRRRGDDPVRHLARAESLLAASAGRSDLPTRLAPHLGILATNLLGGAIVFAFGDARDAAIATTTGILGGQLRLWSQPRRGRGDLEAYEARFEGRATSTRWEILPVYRGLTIRVEF